MKQKKEKYKQSETVIISRLKINFAAYNPRKKDPKVVSKLKANFKKIGFMGGIVWNEASGNLVSGHKRTEALDLINGFDGTKEKDYQIKVEKVNLTEKEEKEQNIFFNSANAQGEFDLDILRDLIPNIDYEAAGLNDMDLNIIGVSHLDATNEISDDINEVIDIQEQARKKEKVKEIKRGVADKLQKEWEGDPYFTVSFDDYTSKSEFLHKLGLDRDERFVKGELLDKKVKIISKF